MKRRGFTLIELMVVIAIIIILAAIAIPNYLTMTARAKKSRVASDFAALATALETFRTDWGIYPKDTGSTLVATHVGYEELAGNGATGTVINKVSGSTGGITAAGDKAPIVYMTDNILNSMHNPYNAANFYKYFSSTDGNHWKLSASESTTGEVAPWWWRSDTTTILTEELTTAPAAPAAD